MYKNILCLLKGKSTFIRLTNVNDLYLIRRHVNAIQANKMGLLNVKNYYKKVNLTLVMP